MEQSVTLEALKLSNVTVNFISLVKKPATRMPFKVFKNDEQSQEKNMSSGKVEEITKGVLIGFRVKKQDSYPCPEGYSLKEDKDSEYLTFLKEDFSGDMPKDDLSYIEIKGGQALVVGVEKYLSTYTMSTNFMEVLQIEGIYTSLWKGIDALTSVMYNILEEGDSKDDFVIQSQEAITQFSGYMLTLIQSIPEEIIKMDVTINKSDDKDADNKGTEDKGTEKNTSTKDVVVVSKSDTNPTEDSILVKVLAKLEALETSITASIEKSDSLTSSTGSALLLIKERLETLDTLVATTVITRSDANQDITKGDPVEGVWDSLFIDIK